LKGNYAYKDIKDTFSKMRIQIIDGLPWACDNLPDFDNPHQMWKYFKLRTQFKNDPAGTELLQSIDTMMEGNYWGKPGLGDCDCFSIALATAMTCQGWPNYITIVSTHKRFPVHIYNEVEWDGQRYVMDLTNPYFDQERDKYNYYQTIPVKL